MKKSLVLVLLAICFLFATVSYAYEFHLLNGPVIEGDIIAFRDGLFKVNTWKGILIIEAAKVNYIKLEDKDRKRPVTCSGFERSTANPENWPPEPPEIGAVPAPLENRSLLPHPFNSWSSTVGGGQKTLQRGFKGGQ